MAAVTALQAEISFDYTPRNSFVYINSDFLQFYSILLIHFLG